MYMTFNPAFAFSKLWQMFLMRKCSVGYLYSCALVWFFSPLQSKSCGCLTEIIIANLAKISTI